jgi:hypothetical protein
VWGQNHYGQIGNGTVGGNVLLPTFANKIGVTTPPAKMASMGGYYVVALLEDGTIRAWGWNGGEGLPNTDPASKPTEVQQGIACLATGDQENRTEPAEPYVNPETGWGINTDKDIFWVDAGMDHVCAIKTKGNVISEPLRIIPEKDSFRVEWDLPPNAPKSATGYRLMIRKVERILYEYYSPKEKAMVKEYVQENWQYGPPQGPLEHGNIVVAQLPDGTPISHTQPGGYEIGIQGTAGSPDGQGGWGTRYVYPVFPTA